MFHRNNVQVDVGQNISGELQLFGQSTVLEETMESAEFIAASEWDRVEQKRRQTLLHENIAFKQL